MTTIRLPLEVVQGIEFRRRFRAYGDMEKTLPIDFVGYEIELTARTRQWIQAPLVISATTGNGRVEIGVAGGFFDVVIEAGATAVLEDGDYYYWLAVYPTDHTEMTSLWLEGPLKVLPGIV